MQARRNPPPLSEGYAQGFDTCFKVGRAGFAVADLRSNRNARLKRVWLPEQMENIRRWVEANREGWTPSSSSAWSSSHTARRESSAAS